MTRATIPHPDTDGKHDCYGARLAALTRPPHCQRPRIIVGTAPAQLRALYPDKTSFTQRVGRGPQSYRELKALLSHAQRDGYALENGEITPGLVSIGVVVRDHMGWPAAGIAVTFPADVSATPDAHPHESLQATISGLLPTLTQTAQELGRRIHGTK
ncbi:MAG: hypothetical protein JJE28_09760 [Actinomycetales bacterium]|nr:hypothetical protein [Actinomycetales bacterium]